jgi:hypothetical protein
MALAPSCGCFDRKRSDLHPRNNFRAAIQRPTASLRPGRILPPRRKDQLLQENATLCCAFAEGVVKNFYRFLDTL